jgi:hypothetical protein
MSGMPHSPASAAGAPSTIDGIRRRSRSYALTPVSLQLALSVPATSQLSGVRA